MLFFPAKAYAIATPSQERPPRSLRALQHRGRDSFGGLGPIDPHRLVFLRVPYENVGIADSSRSADLRAIDQPPRRRRSQPDRRDYRLLPNSSRRCANFEFIEFAIGVAAMARRDILFPSGHR